MAEENVYANVATITGQNKGFQVQEAPQRRSNKVALVVVSVLLLAAVSAFIGVMIYYYSPFKDYTDATDETSDGTVDYSTQPTETTAAVTITAVPGGRVETTERTAAVTTTAVPVPTCPNIVVQCDKDWELNGTKCYYFSTKGSELSWTKSREKCQSLGGDLVKINSREEQGFLDDKVRMQMNVWDDKFWIGLTDSETEGQWLWTDGSKLNQSLAFWTKNEKNTEPDNWTEEDPDGEDCVRMGENEQINGFNSWYDLTCKTTQRYICEKTALRSLICN